MDSIILILLLLGFTFLIKKYAVSMTLSSKDVLIAWGIKLVFGLIYLYIFIEYYGQGTLYGDSYRFYLDSKVLSELAIDYPIEYLKLMFGLSDTNSELIWPYMERTVIWDYSHNTDFINDNRLILKINSIIHLISFGNLYIHSLFHIFFSFIGIRLIFSVFSKFVKQKKWFWYALVLIPSVSFWGGAILKESILILGIGLLFYGLQKLMKSISVKYLIVLVIGVVLVTYNKPYAGLIIFPLSFLMVLGKYFNWSIIKLKWTIFSITVIFILLMFAPTKINLTQKVSYKQKDLINIGNGGVFFITDSSFCFFDYNLASNFEMVNDSLLKVNVESKGEYKLFGTNTFKPFTIPKSETLYPHYLTQIPSSSFFEVKPIANSPWQLIKSIPSAIINVHLRPLPWDNGNKIKIFASIQNFGLLFLLLYAIINKRPFYNKDKWIMTMLIFSVLFITLLIGWTTPIFGAIVRYKVPLDLFIIIISFILLKQKKHETN